MSINVTLKIAVLNDESKSVGEKTPILAALRSVEVDPTWPARGALVDARADFEEFFFDKKLLVESGQKDLGHLIVSERGGESLEDLELTSGVWLTTEKFSDGTRIAMGQIQPKLFESDQWSRFREAFNAMDIFEEIKSQQLQHGGQPWISKIDIAQVLRSKFGNNWESLVTEYLESYVSLVAYSDSLDSQFTRFVARYPFSISVWSLEVSPRLVGVMLSPFHPLRLAWITSVLDTLRSSTLAPRIKEMLLGAISGWQFPMSSMTPMGGGALFAQPIDDGPESLFVGWSMLVPVTNDTPRLISAPISAAGMTLPATSGSGLTTAGAEESVETFFELNPFVSTVVVDLAATQASLRLDAVDVGVIRAIKAWRSRRAKVGVSLGGVRVYDSKNRTGDAPKSAATLGEVDGRNLGVFSWRRYDPGVAIGSKLIEPNIRILNDSGMSYIAIDRGEGTGVIAQSLLRRIEIVEWDSHARAVRLAPSLTSDSGSSRPLDRHFHQAIMLCESRPLGGVGSIGDRFEVRAVHNGPLLARADWLVAGDSGIPPVALSEMLQPIDNGRARMTLWEWNAPMFGARRKISTRQIAQRPYVVVAETNPSFLVRLRSLVGVMLPVGHNEEDENKAVDRILQRLGSRGIGVSALYADNALGSPQTGAIGFWLAYELIDTFRKEGWVLLTVPLDKIRSLMDELGPVSITGINNQRADIALIALAPGKVRLLPIEVKCTGLRSPHSDFENPITAVESLLGRGINQALRSREQFEVVAKKLSEFDTANSALLRTALLSLIDIGTRLSSGPSENLECRQMLVRCLDSLSRLDEPLDIKVAHPAVLSFEAHNSSTRERYIETPGEKRKVHVFQADPRVVANDLAQGKGSTITLFGEMCTKALGEVGGGSDESSGQSLGSVSGNDPNVDKLVVADGEVTAQTKDPELVVTIERPSPIAPSAEIIPPTDRGIVFNIGVDLDTTEAVDYWPSNTNLTNMNIGVFGEMGTGKTQLCLSLLYRLHQQSLASQGRPITGLVLDPKNDYGRVERLAFQEAVGAQVLIPHNMPLDVIGITADMDDLAKSQRISTFVDLLCEVMGRGVGQVQRDVLYSSINALVKALRRSPTMVEMRDAYRLARGRADSVSGLLGDFVNNQVFVSDPSLFKPMSDLIGEKLVILNLKPLQARSGLLKQVMAFAVNQYFDMMLQMPIPPFRDGADGVRLRELRSVLLIDEANIIMRLRFQQLDDILLQGRESGIAAIISSQFPEHFINSDMDYASKLRTWFMHRVPRLTPAQLRNFGVAESIQATSDRILGLDPFQSFFASGLGQSRFVRETPFHEIMPDKR